MSVNTVKAVIVFGTERIRLSLTLYCALTYLRHHAYTLLLNYCLRDVLIITINSYF